MMNAREMRAKVRDEARAEAVTGVEIAETVNEVNSNLTKSFEFEFDPISSTEIRDSFDRVAKRKE